MELASFEWPLRELSEFERLLSCTHASPSFLIGGEFTGAVRDECIAREAPHSSRVAISVDLRACERPGPHAILDLRLVAMLKVWDEAYLYPPCTHQVLSDTTSLAAKIDDGRAFWGIAFFIYCWCVCALKLLVEQPNTVIPRYYLQPSQTLRPCDVGDPDNKPINLYCRGRAPVALLSTPVAATTGHGRLADFEDAEERDRWRSSWARFPSLVSAVTRVASLEPGETPVYEEEIERFAVAWHDAGHPVPAGYRSPAALPPDEESRAYQWTRGRGDGRRVDGVVPFSRRAQWATQAISSTPEHVASLFTIDTARSLFDLVDCMCLIFVCMQSIPLVYCHVNGFTLLGMQASMSAAQRLRIAAAAAETMLEGAGRITYLAGRFNEGRGASVYVTPTSFSPPQSSIVRSAAERRRRRHAGFSFLWLTLGALAGTQSADAAGRAIWATQALRTEVGAFSEAAAPGQGGVFRFGATSIESVVDRPADLRQAPSSADRILERGVYEGGLLRDLLLEQHDDYLGDWAAQMEPPPLAELPLGLLEQVPTFDDARFDDLPFASIAPPPRLAKLPRMPPQQPLPPEAPVCIRAPQELMPPHVWRRVHRWLNQTLYDLICIRDLGDACERNRPKVLVVGPGDLYVWARGRVFDFRQSPAECAKLLDHHEALQHTLNVDFYRRHLESYPNQRILGFIEDGVRYRAEVELQTVLVPHLLSLSKGFSSVVKELKRMSSAELQWYTHHATFPFWPMYSLGEGAVPRKLEDRWRRCEEGGGPRQETFDSCGLRAWSINEASKSWHMPQHYHQDERAEWRDFLQSRGLPASQEAVDALAFNRGTKWERQAMPDLSMVMRNLIVLKRVAYLLGEPVYVFGDDVKDYFNHLLNAAEEQWKVNTIFLNDGDVELPTVTAPGGSLTFIAQRRMGFGLHPNSMIAQEHSEAFNFIFRKEADAQEDPILEADPRPSAQRWLEVRRRVEARTGAHERRLYFILMYCDDNIVAVVGAARALRLLRLWKRLTQEAGLIMAIAAKRTLGVWALWVGAVIMAGAGLVAVPKQKLLRASQSIRQLFAGGVAFDEYRSLTGLLEHVRCIARVPRRLMAGLYHPHSAEGESSEGPATIVRPTILMAIKLKQWLDLLARCGGCAITAVLKRADLLGGVAATFIASSDAATDSSPPGIGGFMHGFYWYLELSRQMVEWLHITLLELVAAACSPAIFRPLLPPTARMLQQTDATSAYAVLSHDGGSSEMLAMANELLRATPEVMLGLEVADIAHVAGDGNLAGDAVSRSHLDRLRELAMQLRVRLVRLETPPFVHDILTQLVAHARQRGVRVRRSDYRPPSPPLPPAAIRLLEDFEAGRGRGRRDNTDGDGPPSLAEAIQQAAKRSRPAPSAMEATAAADPLPATRAPERAGRFVPLAAAISGRAAVTAAAAQPSSRALGKRRADSDTGFSSLAEAIRGPRRRGEHANGNRAGAAVAVASASNLPLEEAGLRPRLQRQLMKTVELGGVPLAASSVPRAAITSERLDDLRLGLSRRAQEMADMGASQEQVDRLREALLHAAAMAQTGAAEKTLEKDDLAWSFWRRFCAVYGFNPIVSRELAVNRPDELASRLGIFVLWVYPQLKGRRTPDALPRTALNNYAGAIARILKRDYRLPVPRQAHYEAETKGLLRSYKQIYGTLALAPHRRQPMTRPMWAKVEALAPGQALPGRAAWLANRHDDMTLLRLGRFLWKTAHRLGEIVSLSAVEINYLTREHVSFRIAGVPRRNPTEAELRSMRAGDLVLVAPCSSKADQFGEEHCPFPAVIEYDGTATCAAAALRDIELERPCSGAARATTPLFPRADGQPYSYSQLNHMLHTLIAALFGEQIARVISWHSFRIGLACALRAANCPDAHIQLICRWKCAESLQVYAQLDSTNHTAWLRKAAEVSFDALRTANIPQLDNAEELAELAQPTARTTARPTAQPAGAVAAQQPIPTPLLQPGARVQVQWGDRWFRGTFTSSRAGIGYDGQRTRLYRIWYDAASGWRAQAKWHDLANEQWRPG